MIPRLKPGVTVHVHDICLPYLHQPDVIDGLFQWSETLVLAALLTGNPHLSIEFSLSQLHHDAPEGLRGVFPEYVARPMADGLNLPGAEGHFPSSIYLRTH
ncbi:MAG: hypothetical protein WDN24_13100 [Sphingomonas sp.]